MDPDTTPDPTHFSGDFKDGKKKFFHSFFLINLPAGTLSSVIKILLASIISVSSTTL
jgi:hypothetical protein